MNYPVFHELKYHPGHYQKVYWYVAKRSEPSIRVCIKNDSSYVLPNGSKISVVSIFEGKLHPTVNYRINDETNIRSAPVCWFAENIINNNKTKHMTLNFEQLMNRNLIGFEFGIEDQRMTMTSRSAYEVDYFVVVADDGTNCVVRELKGTRTRTMDRRFAASHVAKLPLLKWNDELQAYQNKINQDAVNNALEVYERSIEDLQESYFYHLRSDAVSVAARDKEWLEAAKQAASSLKQNLLIA